MPADFQNPSVAQKFDTYTYPIKAKLLLLRRLIFEVAASLEEVGAITETLKWGQPSYLTPSKSGSTIRLDQTADGEYALFFNCRTSLIATFKALYPHEFRYEGTRAILFAEQQEIPLAELKHCLALALTYHRHKKQELPL